MLYIITSKNIAAEHCVVTLQWWWWWWMFYIRTAFFGDILIVITTRRYLIFCPSLYFSCKYENTGICQSFNGSRSKKNLQFTRIAWNQILANPNHIYFLCTWRWDYWFRSHLVSDRINWFMSTASRSRGNKCENPLT